jgi:hypothetical protein
MGAGGGMYPNTPYPNDNMGFNRPYYNRGGYSSSGQIPPYGYPPNVGMGYGRGFQRPYAPMNNFGSIMNGFPQNIFPNPIGGGGFFSSPRSTGGGLQSAPPSVGPNGNIQLNRPGEHRPHFDEQ